MKRLAIAFSGPSNTGKTTLICKVAQIFIEQNLKVAIVKHDPKDKAKFDTEGKDSAKFSAVGADVAVVSPTRTTYFLKQMRNLDEIIAGFGDFDILIVEGLKTLPLPRISLFRDKIDEAYLPFSQAIATNLPKAQMDKACPVNFDINDAQSIAKWILDNAKKV
ncbi:molybdopterin-guanine dinucleotide biosynthesis protein B [Campylobacter sp. VBCF_02 NA5]|uniref:molybdopterin-guanine dinucleotide biosynthesis protein B n=1 Tax=unclassified Campylobacter TaxID=2593542 RepID=UPI0022E9E148|nr:MULTISPECIES: molybdopterin-guanine dinucleotide biosynthesis protein B [unclassified Campylobacter]MDA3048873.1 molybdopterin-guanine dinucleotide biosynthesis protein B [Campylobacter sp. JMF_15 NE4]MDA3050416.1 molybdopterin-guanine dinucleotide biosynthesis protein B [Campylobacter sp. JMF_02 ED1]MDA3054988.1 molybdopterin-guanine dinucleotide biosynthesis protein B [Campylobacter sp. VBCF_07 NA4]MDA3060490.1 molybdopterin-guanine dinucleotide biosynthesis protein B [Campylobacter sp. VB